MLPSGTVTFWFTDIVGSTALWEADSETMRRNLEKHNATLDRIAGEHLGHIFKTVGDAYCVAFSDAQHAASAALAAQEALGMKGPKVRMGLHTASIQPSGDDYFGSPLSRVSRLMALAHGGQVLMSEATKGLLSSTVPMADLGSHILRDLSEAMRIWQLGSGQFPPIAGVGSIPNNLPLQVTSFIGREQEMLQVAEFFEKSRLVTLTGAGGTGKTRLALQCAAERVSLHPHGVWFCEFAALPEREDVLRALVAAVGVPDSPIGLQSRLVTHLGERRALLILDNCEHVLDSVAEICGGLLSYCPNVSILATSREPIGVAGEIALRVPSLPVPDRDERLSVADLERFGSTALLLDRLSISSPSTHIEQSQVGSISRICARLDGIPLAIELAAARCRAMSLDQIERRLDDRFRLLTGGNRNALSRQQTLRALVDWSVRLLEPRERRFLYALAVFSGGWSLESCEAVCGGSEIGVGVDEVLDLLTALVDKSLVTFDPMKDRYSMLETIRQYALECFQDDEAATAIRDRHAQWFLRLSDGFGASQSVDQHAETLRRFSGDYENFRVAIEWTAGTAGGLSRSIAALEAAYSGFWSLDRGGEFIRLLDPLLARASLPPSDPMYEPVDEELVKSARVSRAVTGTRVGLAEATEELVAMKEGFHDLPPRIRARSAGPVGYALFRAGKYEEDLEFIAALFADRDRLEDRLSPYLPVIEGNCLCVLSRFDEALDAYERGLAELTSAGDERACVACLANFVTVHTIRGETGRAITVALELNRRCTVSRVYTSTRAFTLMAFGHLALDLRDGRTSAIMLGGALELRRRTGSPPDAVDEMAEQSLERRVSEAVPETDRDSWTAEGRNTDWEPWFQMLLNVSAEECKDRIPAWPI